MRSLIGCCLLAFVLPCCTLLRASIDSVDLVLVTLAGSRAPLLAAAGHPLAMACKVERKCVVTTDDGTQWVPEQKEVGDVTFCAVSKWQRALVRLVQQKALDLRPGQEGGNINVAFWDDLMKARQEAANEALDKALKSEDAPQPPAKRRKKHIKASVHELALLPAVLELSLPATSGAGEHAMRVLSEGLGTTTVWIELTSDNLTFLKESIKASRLKPKRAKAKSAKRHPEQRGSDASNNSGTASQEEG